MKIVVDENIPLATEFFSELGDVVAVPPRKLSAAHLKDATALVVRSVVPIDRELLADSAVKFVGTCTAGYDHFDTDFFAEQGITWASAPGCNANSVVQYVLSTMSALHIDWRSRRVGVIGCGNVGGRLLQTLSALGVSCCGYDPLLIDHSDLNLTSLDDVLSCDVVSVHAPLTRVGDHPSYHLLNEQRLQQLPENALLISAGRGAVVDNAALLKLLPNRQDLSVVLDVWEGEPTIPLPLLNAINLGTPHIAGHSYDGKVTGTEMIYTSFCQFLGREATATIGQFDTWRAEAPLKLVGETATELVQNAIQQVYDVAKDAQQFKQALASNEDKAKAFDQMRKDYPYRREFHNYSVNLTAAQQAASQDLAALGFQII